MGVLRVISHSGDSFRDRKQAGQLLADQLQEYRDKDAVVLGIPRGGVVVAGEIAALLNAELDIVLSHKLGAPANPELAVGAVCEDGKVFVNQSIASYVGAGESYIEMEKQRQFHDMDLRIHQCREIVEKIDLQGRIVIVTDDGVATGATLQAALWVVRQDKPEKLIAALPVGPVETVESLSEDADETVCLQTPPYFAALSGFFDDFTQISDAEMLDILRDEQLRRGEK